MLYCIVETEDDEDQEKWRGHLEKDGGIKKVKKLKYGRTEGKEGM